MFWDKRNEVDQHASKVALFGSYSDSIARRLLRELNVATSLSVCYHQSLENANSRGASSPILERTGAKPLKQKTLGRTPETSR